MAAADGGEAAWLRRLIDVGRSLVTELDLELVLDRVLETGREVTGARYAALGVLNERERRIFEARRLAEDPITLEELADEFGVSRERVRQIEVRAFEKVQSAVKHRVAAMERPTAATQMAAH